MCCVCSPTCLCVFVCLCVCVCVSVSVCVPSNVFAAVSQCMMFTVFAMDGVDHHAKDKVCTRLLVCMRAGMCAYVGVMNNNSCAICSQSNSTHHTIIPNQCVHAGRQEQYFAREEAQA